MLIHRRPSPYILLASLAAIAGCHPGGDKRPPLSPPEAVVRVEHFAGTALSGPQADAPASTADAWGVRVRLIATATAAPAGFERVGPAARLVLGPETGTVVAPSSRLVYSTLIRPLDAGADLAAALGAERDRADLAEPRAALPAGGTASIAVLLPEGAPRTADYPRRAVRVELSRRVGASDDEYDVAVASEDLTGLPPSADRKPIRRADVRRATAEAAAAAEAVAPGTAVEVIVLSRKLVDGVDRFVLAIPATFPGSAARWLIVDVTVGGDAPSDATLATMRSQLDASAAAVAAARTAAAPSADELALASALDSLGSAGASPRGAITFLAGRTGARLAEAVALVADDRVLQVIVGQLRSRLANLPTRDARSVGWLLDRTTIDALSSVSEADAPRVLPPIQGALGVFAGEAGRQLDVLRSLAGESASSADLYERIVAENTILLEESSPALRVRAHDWLAGVGRAPAGFDPLATPQQRRAALERARDPNAATQPAPATQPVPATPSNATTAPGPATRSVSPTQP